ncbi:MAG: CocE/NonD family hydrolase [Chthoniobacterales bacterium]|nr:CocE/NonD family hydrolase [Chthoniobacterales bacterium]
MTSAIFAALMASGGRANTSGGDGRLAVLPSGPADHFVYDPANPVPTQGGAWCFENLGLRDQREIEKRADVLVYTSEPLEEAMEVTGVVTAELYISSSAPDTDFTVKLVDVAPDGRALGVTDGIVRARYRNQVPEGELLEPDKVYRVPIACPPTAYEFQPGHRLRIEISSSNFPVFARNLNTGASPADETTSAIARQTIHHTEEYPSRVSLPVIPRDSRVHAHQQHEEIGRE